MTGVDHAVQRWVVEHRVGWLDPIFQGLSLAGSFGLVWLLLGTVAAVLWRRPTPAFLVLCAVVLADLSAAALKESIQRPRPPLRYPEDPEPLLRLPATGSLPSGHAATSFAAAAILAAAAPRFRVPLLVLAALVASSRLYVGVHYPADIIAGALLGLLVATALRWFVVALPRSRRPRRAG